MAWYVHMQQLVIPLPLVQSGCAGASIDIVVAACKEDLQWLTKISDARIFVYQKCGPVDLPPLTCATVTQLPNQAMESLAYAVHMKTHYSDFAPFTFFVQANP